MRPDPSPPEAPWRADRARWEGRSVAVTGGTGFVGAHLVAALVDLGAAVVVLRRDRPPLHPVVAGWSGAVSFVEGDLTDASVVERLLGDYEVTTLFHLAAQSQVGVANRNPSGTFEANIRGTWTLLEAARRQGRLGAVVMASSDKAYGSQPVLPYTEDMALAAVSPYDVSKACADLLGASYARTWALPVATTRCGNFFGPGDLNWARLVPGTIRSVLAGAPPFVRSDGTMTRDYLHVADGVRAYLQLAESLEADPSLAGEAFNFSLERPVSVLELVTLVQQAAGTDLTPVVANEASHEIEHQALSAGKARRRLGWVPQCSLEAGLADTVAWYRRYLQGQSPAPGRM